jgi:phospholipase C
VRPQAAAPVQVSLNILNEEGSVMKLQSPLLRISLRSLHWSSLLLLPVIAALTGCGGATHLTSPPVTPAPVVTVAATPASIAAGASSTLTVTASNATTVDMTGTDGSSYTMSSTGGTKAVTPAATTTYTVKAVGTGGTVTATAVVTVTSTAPAPTVNIAASPASITAGGSSMLTVTATNATVVVITGSDKSSYTLAATGGTKTVSPTATTTYTAKATGAAGSVTETATVTVTAAAPPPPNATTVTINASPAAITGGDASTLTVVATNATGVTVTGTDKSSYTLGVTGGTQSVSPTATTTYTATASGANGNVTASTTVTVTAPASVQAVNHVVFMLQENHTFDNYFGMLNPYRAANKTDGQPWNMGDDGNTYTVDGIDDKLSLSNQDDEGDTFKLFKFTSTCIDDATSAWLESYGDVNRYDFTPSRKINMDGFVHDAEGFAKSCAASGNCSGAFTDTSGQRAMGYYDQQYLNYYYYMAAQFAVSDRWFSPITRIRTSHGRSITR